MAKSDCIKDRFLRNIPMTLPRSMVEPGTDVSIDTIYKIDISDNRVPYADSDLQSNSDRICVKEAGRSSLQIH